jgi:hypothetical protein
MVVPAAIDWRNAGGQNFVTPVRDQSSCGSCVAFGASATLESLVCVEYAIPDLPIDLSEMHLFHCGGGTCDFGWWNTSACIYLRDNGVPDETCWPYIPDDRPCSHTCADWRQRATLITTYGRISGIESCKAYTAIAPILVAFDVYADFYYYSDGIYEHTWGDLEGGHAVSIVGYDTTGPTHYWIVKNSWGTGWGENGYFKIKMGECRIEDRESCYMAGAIMPSEPDVVVFVDPDASNVQRGGQLGCTATVSNTTDQVQIVLFATDVALPNGKVYPANGYLVGPKRVTLPAQGALSHHLSHSVPSGAAIGVYSYCGYVGKAGPGVIHQDEFPFTVTD